MNNQFERVEYDYAVFGSCLQRKHGLESGLIEGKVDTLASSRLRAGVQLYRPVPPPVQRGPTTSGEWGAIGTRPRQLCEISPVLPALTTAPGPCCAASVAAAAVGAAAPPAPAHGSRVPLPRDAIVPACIGTVSSRRASAAGGRGAPDQLAEAHGGGAAGGRPQRPNVNALGWGGGHADASMPRRAGAARGPSS